MRVVNNAILKAGKDRRKNKGLPVAIYRVREMKKYQIILLICVQGLLSSCSENKNEIFSEYQVDIKEDYKVLISSTITKKEYRGAITNADYGSTVNVSYKLRIKNKNRTIIDSYLGSEEPKHLLVCPNEIMLHVVGEYYNKTNNKEESSEPNTEATEEYKMEVKARYKKLIDERYFFNLLGDVFWIVDEKNLYQNQLANTKDCSEHPLSNENFYKDIR